MPWPVVRVIFSLRDGFHASLIVFNVAVVGGLR